MGESVRKVRAEISLANALLVDSLASLEILSNRSLRDGIIPPIRRILPRACERPIRAWQAFRSADRFGS